MVSFQTRSNDMHKFLFSTLASVTFIMPFVFSPSAKWIKLYTNQPDGSSITTRIKKLSQTGTMFTISIELITPILQQKVCKLNSTLLLIF